MLKRTTGRILLALLVITGLAGTVENSSLSQKERKQAIQLMKSSRSRVLQSIEGLTPRQLDYRSVTGVTIRQLFDRVVAAEDHGSRYIRECMQQPTNAEQRLKIEVSDEALLGNSDLALCESEMAAAIPTGAKHSAPLLKDFIALRNNNIRYLRTSTEDLRNHVVQTPAGWIDCYQYFLLLADQSNYAASSIEKIKKERSFPHSR